VYFDYTPNVTAAIEREKQIKGWTRAKKVALIESINPTWEDLSDGWAQEADSSR
jgi:putative endonuclease